MKRVSEEYYYDKNTLGDFVAKYEYDACGNETVIVHALPGTAGEFSGHVNPFRCRGF